MTKVAKVITILGKEASINVRKVQWTCDEVGLPYTREDWGIGFRATSEPDFLALNPNAMVPVIKDGDVTLWQSNTICRYLAGREKRMDLLPTAPRERADVEKWMDWQAMELNPAWRYVFMGRMRGDPACADPAETVRCIQNWNKYMAILDRQVAKTNHFVAGASFTLADIVLGLSVHRWYTTLNDKERPKLDAIDAYCARLKNRPAFTAYCRPDLP